MNEDTWTNILVLLDNKDLLMMRTVNAKFNNIISHNTYLLRIFKIRNENIKHLPLIDNKNIFFDLNITHDNNMILSNIPNLKILNVKANNNITDDYINNLTDLTSLNIAHNTNITNKGINRLVNLRELDIIGCSQITEEGLQTLTNLRTLTTSKYINLEELKKTLPSLINIKHAGPFDELFGIAKRIMVTYDYKVPNNMTIPSED